MKAMAAADQWVTHTRIVLSEFDGLLSAIKDAETGQRGFIITGDRHYLEPYEAGRGEIEARLASLRGLTADNAGQQKRLTAITSLVAAKLTELEKTMALRESKGFQAASAEVKTDIGKSLMDELRLEVDQAEAEEQQLLQVRAVAKHKETLLTYRAVALGGAMAGLALLMLLAALQVELARRRRAEAGLRLQRDTLEQQVEARTQALRQEQEALRESQAKLQAAMDSMTDAVFISDTEGRFLEFNEAFATFHRFKSKEECAKTFAEYPDILEVSMPDGEPAPVDMWAVPRALRGERVVNAEYTLRRKDTGETWVGSYSFGPIRDKDGAIVGSVVVGRDITELKRVQEVLRESEERFRALANAMPQLAWVTRPDGFIFWYNQRWYEYTGKTPKEMEGWGWQSVHDPVELPTVLERWKKAIATGEPFEMTFPLRGSDGSFRLFLTRGVPVKDAAGKIINWFGTNTDVEELKRAEEALRKSEKRFRTTMDNMLEGCQILGRDWRYIYINDAAERQNRRPKGELIGRRYMDVWPGIESTRVFDVIRRCIAQGVTESFENEFTFPDGAVGWFELSVQPVPEGVFIISMDITERRRAEEARARLASIVDSSDDAIIAKNLDGTILSWNPGAERLYGYSAQEVIGKSISIILPSGHDDEVPAILERIARCESVPTYDTVRRTKDGRNIDVALTVSPVKDKDGRIVGASTICRDISERKRLQEALRQSYQKLEARVAQRTEELARSNKDLEQFAYVASHDLQEPLRMVASFTQLLEKRYGDKLGQEAKEFIGYAVDGATRMQRLINDLLTFSRVASRGQKASAVDAQAALDEALGNLRPAISEAGAAVSHDALPTVRADYGQLVQLFQNLIGNALKFHGEKPARVHVAARQDHGRVVFSVQDNGIGIEPEFFERIFVIFQRLHGREKYPGTGIGLAVCKKIVERQGGKLWVESQPGQGATFYFSIPEQGG
jgi:PAS domain S-box-containing protein